MSDNSKKGSDLQGLSSLMTDATLGITDLVEEMHKRIVHPPFLPSTPVQHLITKLAGFTYSTIKKGVSLMGVGLDKGLGVVSSIAEEKKQGVKIETFRALLNGLVGDYLEKKGNPLAIEMQFRYQAESISLESKRIDERYPKVNGKILVMVHGCCMNDIQWTRKDHNHGIELSEELDKTTVYLYYNSGLHISINGQRFSKILEKLIENWPVPVDEISIIAHSMGGLVSRSAIHYGQVENKKWIKRLKKIIFLGTPHHGAPMERIGNYVDEILEFIPYTKPLAKLGKTRSAGVTDLRYGNLLDEDWKDNNRFEIKGDQRQHIALPKQVQCYSIAAVKVRKNNKAGKILGDGLVDVKSALGKHIDSSKELNFSESNTWISYENNHMDLLSNPKTYAKIKDWLS